MKKMNLERFDARRYAKHLDEEEIRMMAARKMDGSSWHRERRRSKVLAEIYRLAMRKQGVNRTELGQRILQLSNSRTRAIQRVTCGEVPRFEKWLFACDLANIPRADAVVLWARESIPDHFAEYKKYVGSTLKRRKLREMDWQKNPTAEDKETSLAALRFIKDEVGLKYRAKPMPDHPKDLNNLTR